LSIWLLLVVEVVLMVGAEVEEQEVIKLVQPWRYLQPLIQLLLAQAALEVLVQAVQAEQIQLL
jgi:hypothetical protein